MGACAMPRRQKPAGKEKWTWDEINAGRRMSKSEKRYRRMAVNLGATKRDDGSIQPPTFGENPHYYFVFGFLVLVLILVLLIKIAETAGK
jgi:hypothetical protein